MSAEDALLMDGPALPRPAVVDLAAFEQRRTIYFRTDRSLLARAAVPLMAGRGSVEQPLGKLEDHAPFNLEVVPVRQPAANRPLALYEDK
jgi:hypothetical protein